MQEQDDLLRAKIGQRKKQEARVCAQQLLYDGYAQLKKLTWEHQSFQDNRWLKVQRECLIRREAAALLPYDPLTDKVVLLQQARIGPLVHGANPWMLEIVAGVADIEGESPESLAKREALEEAGLHCYAIEPICSYFASPGCTNEYIHVFCGFVEAPEQSGIYGVPEEGEDIKTVIITFDEAMDALQSGMINNAVSIIALQWLSMHRDKLRKSR